MQSNDINILAGESKEDIIINAILGAEHWLVEYDLQHIKVAKEEHKKVLACYLDIVNKQNRQPNESEVSDLTGEYISGVSVQSDFDKVFNTLQNKKYSGLAQYCLEQAKQAIQATPDIKTVQDAIMQLQARIGAILPVTEGFEGNAVAKMFKQQIDEYESLKNQLGLKYIGIPTGFSNIDEGTEGLQPGHLWIFGARSSGGKTTLALNVVHHALTQKKRVAFFSLEMTETDIFNKLVALEGDVGLKDMLKASLPKTQRDAIIDKVGSFDFKIYGINTKHINDIVSAVTKEVYTNRPDIVVIDYLQQIKGDGSNETSMREYVAHTLQAMSLKLKLPVICLSQMNNAHLNSGYENTMSIGLKGAGAYADVANFVFEIVLDIKMDAVNLLRETNKPIPKKLVTLKSRNGGMITEYFLDHGYNAKFEQVTRDVYYNAVDNAIGETTKERGSSIEDFDD